MDFNNWYEKRVEDRGKLKYDPVKMRMQEKGVLQNQLAKKLGITESTLSSMLHGNQWVSMAHLKVMGETLGLPVTESEGPVGFKQATEFLMRWMRENGIVRIEIAADGTITNKLG